MNEFWNSDTYKIVKAMKATGNKPGIVTQWKAAIEQWALNAVNDPDAAAVRAWLPLWQVRIAYTPTELAPLWPALAIAIGIEKRMSLIKSPMRLMMELDFARLPYREIEGRRYYIVEYIHIWKNVPQAAFRDAIFNA